MKARFNIMFDLNKEIDEIRLEYYISNNATAGLIEFSLSEIAKQLNISKSKAQRLIDKFIKLAILEVKEKSNSRTNKTIYRYLKTITETNIDTVKTEKIDIKEVLSDTGIDTNNDTIYSVYEQKFKLNKFIKGKLNEYCDDMDLELFEYLIEHISSRADIKVKEGYLLKLLKDLKRNNIKSIEEFFNHTKNHKQKKNWNYTEPDEDINFDEIVRLTRK